MIRKEKRKAQPWAEAALDAAIKPVGALTLTTNGQLARNPATRELMLETLREAVGILRARGRKPAPRGLSRVLLRACRAAPNQLSPMSQDLLAGRRTEADSLLRSLVREARAARRPAPLLGALYRIIKRLEEELRVP